MEPTGRTPPEPQVSDPALGVDNPKVVHASFAAGAGFAVDNVHKSVYIVHMARERHPHKEIEKSLKQAETAAFDIEVIRRGHVWGKVIAPDQQALTVWSTPRSPETMAKRVREFVRRHRND